MGLTPTFIVRSRRRARCAVRLCCVVFRCAVWGYIHTGPKVQKSHLLNVAHILQGVEGAASILGLLTFLTLGEKRDGSTSNFLQVSLMLDRTVRYGTFQETLDLI